MIIKCIANSGAALPAAYHSQELGITRSTEYYITPGHTYLVLAVTNLLGYNFFYILEDDSEDSPTLVPAPLFEITNGRLSRHWCYRQRMDGDGVNDYFFMLSFPEWSDGGVFLENLMDGSSSEVARFKEQLQLLQADASAEQV